VPTFRSLLVIFDPDRTDRDALLAALPGKAAEATLHEPTNWRLPIAMEGEAAEDIDAAAAGLGITAQTLRDVFLSGRYQVGMYGFAPGFAYLSGVDKRLAIPRRASPRPPMPAGSLILAGGMAALTSISMPTGWYVIGRTAITLFRPEAARKVPFAVGDTITFSLVSEAQCAALAKTPDGGLKVDR
ncbi:MAG: carboxyltransferase domain-containing protein, partial [Pseudomonadota bacterium]